MTVQSDKTVNEGNCVFNRSLVKRSTRLIITPTRTKQNTNPGTLTLSDSGVKCVRQNEVRELALILLENGSEIKFASLRVDWIFNVKLVGACKKKKVVSKRAKIPSPSVSIHPTTSRGLS